MGLREFTLRRVLWKNIKNTAEKRKNSMHPITLVLFVLNSIHLINRHILFYEAKTHRINEYIRIQVRILRQWESAFLYCTS